MLLAISYITYGYCIQSHLSSEDYDQAMQGLRTTRWVRTHLTGYSKIPVAFFKRVHPPPENRETRPYRLVGGTPSITIPMPEEPLLQIPRRSHGQAYSRDGSSDLLQPLASPTPEGSSHSRSSSEGAMSASVQH